MLAKSVLDDPIPALKRQLANEILSIANQLNFWLAAALLGIDASRLSDLRRGRIARFSVERLIRMLATAERRVELRVIANAPYRDGMRILSDRRRQRQCTDRSAAVSTKRPSPASSRSR